jgi:hypothetical protein
MFLPPEAYAYETMERGEAFSWICSEYNSRSKETDEQLSLAVFLPSIL